MSRLRNGNIIEVNGRKAIVIKAGKSRTMQSAFVEYEGGGTQLLTEVAFWMAGKSPVIQLLDQDGTPKPKNVRYAKAWRDVNARTRNDIPDI